MYLNYFYDPKGINLFHMFVVAVLLFLITTPYFPHNINKMNFLRYLAVFIFIFHGYLYYKKMKSGKKEGYDTFYANDFHGPNGTIAVKRQVTPDIVGKGKVHYIRMFDSDPGYSQPRLIIKKGDVVVWMNVGEVKHTVTSASMNRYMQGIMEPSDDFNSGYMYPGMTFAVKFKENGTFPYYSILQKGWMQGVVIVK